MQVPTGYQESRPATAYYDMPGVMFDIEALDSLTVTKLYLPVTGSFSVYASPDDVSHLDIHDDPSAWNEVFNGTADMDPYAVAYTRGFRAAIGGLSITIPAGERRAIYVNGTNGMALPYFELQSMIVSGSDNMNIYGATGTNADFQAASLYSGRGHWVGAVEYFMHTEGCTNPEAVNYDPVATCDNGSCE